MFLQDIKRAISRPPVDDDVLDIGIMLVEHALNILFEKTRLVE
jgi:hypothetical protein